VSEYPNQRTWVSETIGKYLNLKNLEKKGKTPAVFLILERLISAWVQEERSSLADDLVAKTKGVMLFGHPSVFSKPPAAGTRRGSSPENPALYLKALCRAVPQALWRN